jgi:hypothetical protein
MNETEIVRALTELVETLEEFGIPYHIGGSVASSVYGLKRVTEDADIVADIQYEHIRPLVRRLEAEYYIHADAIRGAIRYRSSFNAIHLASMLKIDVFIPKARQFAQQEHIRSRPKVIVEGSRPFLFSSPEDIILNKLEWYRMGNEVSTRQWRDILGVLNEQRASLDIAYLQHWAANLRVGDLLARAFVEAGLKTE